MELNRKRSNCNAWNIRELNGGQGRSRTADTRIFSPLTVPGLCDTIGRYVYLSKRLTVLPASRFYRFVHTVTYSSGKVVGKVGPSRCARIAVAGGDTIERTLFAQQTVEEIRPSGNASTEFM